ncbi:hypothetical protein BJ322DRAFT_1106266 [Thelephora terrestris]|uniref:Uncharacterized protein n=1 Tax=Thelephora terrestris TaxID=56493 RepID=A0A9P6L8P8_9AGAM|nr:hypothetical protein BJ322DRAFT_1106266 [Thelephora terrestris]
MLARKCRVRPVSKRAFTTPRFFSLNRDRKRSESISDAEWEVRTGRAITVLTETLPHFFSTGLVLSIDKSKLPDIMDASLHSTRNGTGVRSVVEGVGSLITGRARTELVHDSEADELETHGDNEPIYSSKIQLFYTPKGFERSLHIQGAPLYITSSVFVRHTLNALYSDLKVDLLNARTTPSPPSSSSTSPSSLGKARDRSLSMRIGVSGLARVSGAKTEWEVDYTYNFSPATGLILIHTINSIHPAPHESVYEAFRLGFGRLGLGFNPQPGADAQGTICRGSTPRKVNDMDS